MGDSKSQISAGLKDVRGPADGRRSEEIRQSIELRRSISLARRSGERVSSDRGGRKVR